MLNPGILLQGRYRIIRQIGGGGMGTVYLAENTRLADRQSAIKELSPDQVPAQERSWVLQTLQQEVELLSKLSHPGLTSITDYFTEGSNQYLVMDYIEGDTLEAKLARSKDQRLPRAEALEITRQLCEVLRYLHDRTEPIIFRDLKPANILLTAQGQVKLIDFGIARLFKPGQSHDTINLGTPGYAAPEQYGGKGQTSPISDIYSLGVVLHQMLTGYDPTGTPFNLPVTRTLNAGVPAYLEAAIRKAIQIDPKQRFQSVAQIQRALFKRQANAGRRVGALLALVGLIGVTGAGGYIAWNNGLLSFSATPIAAILSTSTPTVTPVPTLTNTATLTPSATETRRPTATLRPRQTSTLTSTPTVTPSLTPRPVTKMATLPRTSTPMAIAGTAATTALVAPTHAPATQAPLVGEVGRILFTTDLGGLYLYSVNPDGGAPTQLGQTDRAHSTCSSNATVATVENRVFGIYRGPYCALARLGDCHSPDGRWLARYSAKGRADGSGTIVTSPKSDESQVSFVVDGMVNAPKGILWAPDSSGFVFYVDGNFFFAVPGQDGFRPIGAGEIISWSPDSTMLLIKEINDIGVQRLDGQRQLLINGQIVSSVQCPVWRVP